MFRLGVDQSLKRLIGACHFQNILLSNTWRILIGALIAKTIITIKSSQGQLSCQVLAPNWLFFLIYTSLVHPIMDFLNFLLLKKLYKNLFLLANLSIEGAFVAQTIQAFVQESTTALEACNPKNQNLKLHWGYLCLIHSHSAF